MSNIKRIGVLTSGGDCSGLNAVIRAVVNAATLQGWEVLGIKFGTDGLTNRPLQYEKLTVETFSDSPWPRLSGSYLGSLNSGVKLESVETLSKRFGEGARELGLDALVVIGGDGSLCGARQFAREFDFPIVGIPGTIDNDLSGTDHTIGYDTALNTIMWCVDRIRDTASSHERLFFIEVMGREAGFLALNGAIASGAEAAIIPEIAPEVDQLKELVRSGFRKTKNSSIVLVAESPITGGAMGLAERVRKEYPKYDVRVTILGHLQRGGSPTAQDRILASRMGAAAIDALLEGQRNIMIGDDDEKMIYVPFSKAIRKDKPIDRDLFETLHKLSL